MEEESGVSLSFAGCGFMCVYHAGVCAAIKEYAPQILKNRVYGASAGAIAAAGLLCDIPVAEATTTILQVVSEARAGSFQAFNPTFDLMAMVRDGLHRHLPDNAHEICSGRLFISLTRHDFKNVIVSEFESKKELIEAILCSCFIPVVAGLKMPTFRGVKYFDGGFSDNQPVLDEKTITVSPFSGESDICPIDNDSASILGFVYKSSSMRFTTENLFRFVSICVPPSKDVCSKICRQGYSDTLRFLWHNFFIPCFRCPKTFYSNPEVEANEGSKAEKRQSHFYLDISRPPRRKDVMKRRRDDPCEKCHTTIQPIDELFPAVLHEMLIKERPVRPTISSYVNYFLSFRITQFGLSLAKPFLIPIRYAITPIEYAIFVLNCMRRWLMTMVDPDMLFSRLLRFIDFVLRQIEDHNLLCSSRLPYRIISSPTPRAITNDKPDDVNDVQIEEYYCYLASPQNSDSLCSLILQMEKIDSEAIQYYSKMELPVDKTSTHLKGARKHSHIKHFISDKGFLSSISSFNQHRSPLKNLPQTKNTNKKLSKSSAMEESVKGKHWRNVQAHARSAENLLTRRNREFPAEDSGISLAEDGVSQNEKRKKQNVAQNTGILPHIKFRRKSSTSIARRHTVEVPSTASNQVENSYCHGHSNPSSSFKNSNNNNETNKDAFSSSDISDAGESENLFVPNRQRNARL